MRLWDDLKYGIALAYNRGAWDRAGIVFVVIAGPLVLLISVTGIALIFLQ